MNNLNEIAITEIHPHPHNPRIEPRQDVVDQLAEHIRNGLDPSHALIVRPNAKGYEVISGHHRLLAAEQAGLETVPCWVRELSDADAYMQLVLCNTQSELHPLEEGKHAAESGMDLKAYAEQAGKARQSLQYKVYAWHVLSAVPHVRHSIIRDSWRNLAEIHAAPEWLWPALVQRMTEGEWTVATTRQTISNYRNLPEPPEWCDRNALAEHLLNGQVGIPDIGRMADMPGRAKVSDADLRESMVSVLSFTRPALPSAVMEIIKEHENQQAQRDKEKRDAELETQRQQEVAAQRVKRLRETCSLEEWKTLGDAERKTLITPNLEANAGFNAQKNEAIEWAQWSWNPVTGCLHDCPYCYARDIANETKMADYYPFGFAPAFRPNALAAPYRVKVPKAAETDSRHRNVFTCSMADLFGRWVPIEWIQAVMQSAADNPQWNFLFLTKFPKRLAEIQIPQNAWMGTTVDMQARVKNAEDAFERVEGCIKWLSIEPMIEPLKFTRLHLFDWVVIGGASSSSQTPAWQPPFPWIADLVEQCREAGTKVYFKTNLLGNRIIELPIDAPIKTDPTQAPDSFRYLGK